MKTNQLLKFSAVALLFVRLAGGAAAQEVTATFTNSFGDGIWQRDAHIGVIGNVNDPSSPGNWDTGAYPDYNHKIQDPNTGLYVPNPTPDYDVIIALPTTCTLGPGNYEPSIRTLNVAAVSTLDIAGGSLIAITNGSVVNNGLIRINTTDPLNSESDLRFDSDTQVTGSGSILLNGVGYSRANFNLNAHTVTVGASQLIHGYGTVIGFGGGTLINDGTINGDDPTSTMQLILSHTNQNNNLIEATNGAILTMDGGGIDQTGGGTLLADGSGSSVQFFAANNGTDFPVVIGGILTTANGGIVEPGQPGANAVFLQGCTNNGDLRIPGGEVIVVTGSGLTNNGSILINSTDPINSVSDLRWDASGTLGGTGSVLLNGVGFNRANLDLSVATVTIGANQLIHGYGTVVGFNGATMINNGTINGDDASGNNMQLDLANTTNQNNGTIEATNGGVIGFYSGTIDQTGGGTFLATGNSSKAQLGTFNGNSYGHIIGGTLNGTSGGVVSSLASILDGDITNSGAFEIPADGIVLSYASTLTNNGTITMDDNTGLFRFDQNNTAIGGTGSIALTNGAQVTINGGQAVSNGSGHTIKGNGTIGIVGGGTLTNNGFIAPGLSPGQLNLNGDLELNFPSKLAFEIGGPTPISQYDVLNKIDGGTLSLNGKLILNLINGFTPQQTDTFTILTTQTALGGNFTNVKSGGRMNTEDGGGSFQVDYHVINNAPLSQVVTLSSFGPVLPPSQGLNISTRADVGTGQNVAIAGFIINGTDPKKVIIRGIGPSLSSFGLANVLADPTLALHDSNPNDPPLATNDNWKDTQQTEIQNSGHAPSNDLESAIITTLAPGTYTAILSGNNPGTGIGLVEVFDLDQAANSRLGNISTRGFVGTGDNVLIGGTIVGPSNGNSSPVLVRAVGPSLASLGVVNPLQDPTLELHDANGALFAFNDNWKDVQQEEIKATGHTPSDDNESAIFLALAPGGWTAIVRGKNGATGVALVEVFNVQ
jgi:hypothetical protein